MDEDSMSSQKCAMHGTPKWQAAIMRHVVHGLHCDKLKSINIHPYTSFKNKNYCHKQDGVLLLKTNVTWFTNTINKLLLNVFMLTVNTAKV